MLGVLDVKIINDKGKGKMNVVLWTQRPGVCLVGMKSACFKTFVSFVYVC